MHSESRQFDDGLQLEQVRTTHIMNSVITDDLNKSIAFIPEQLDPRYHDVSATDWSFISATSLESCELFD